MRGLLAGDTIATLSDAFAGLRRENPEWCTAKIVRCVATLHTSQHEASVQDVVQDRVRRDPTLRGLVVAVLTSIQHPASPRDFDALDVLYRCCAERGILAELALQGTDLRTPNISVGVLASLGMDRDYFLRRSFQEFLLDLLNKSPDDLFGRACIGWSGAMGATREVWNDDRSWQSLMEKTVVRILEVNGQEDYLGPVVLFAIRIATLQDHQGKVYGHAEEFLDFLYGTRSAFIPASAERAAQLLFVTEHRRLALYVAVSCLVALYIQKDPKHDWRYFRKSLFRGWLPGAQLGF